MEKNENNRQEKIAMIKRWQDGGLSQKDFCREEQIPYHIFHYWYKRVRAGENPVRKKFVKIPANHLALSECRAEVHFANGTRIVLHGNVKVSELKQLAG